MSRRSVALAWALQLIALAVVGCRETCDVCPAPADSIAGFPAVRREGGRVVSTMHVGDVATVCIFADCACIPHYDVKWQSTDAAVASVEEAYTSLASCNDAFDHARTGSAQRVGTIRALQPGETQISALAAGPQVASRVVTAVDCPGRDPQSCVQVDVLRVLP